MGVGDQRQSPGKTRYPSYKRLGGPQRPSGRVRKISPPPRFDPRIVQPERVAITTALLRPTPYRLRMSMVIPTLSHCAFMQCYGETFTFSLYPLWTWSSGKTAPRITYVDNSLQQCFSTFVRPRPSKFFFHKTRARSQQIYSSVPFQFFFKFIH